VLFGLMHVILFHLRTRFPREELIFGVVVALLANLGLFLALSFVLLGDHPASGVAWLRLLADLGWSQLFIAAVAPWFLALQQHALELGRVNLADESHRFF
jgi:rod shape-determining protein MreD